MGLVDKVKPKNLTDKQWQTVVWIAGIGTVLEYYDFYCYSQLSAVLGKASGADRQGGAGAAGIQQAGLGAIGCRPVVLCGSALVFFPSNDPNISALSYWGVFAVAFVARPIGALIFGHIGDKYGRSWTFSIAIIVMAVSTLIIGILPTYDIGPYKAGVAAPVLLAILRFFQGISFAGDFGAAVVYISELAAPSIRGRMVTTLQWSINLGLILASIVVIILQAALTQAQMFEWGWRIPFLLAAFSAVLGYFMRRGMPEPTTFLEAYAKDRAAEGGEAGEPDAKLEISDKAATKNLDDAASQASTSQADAEEEVEAKQKGVLAVLHGHSRSSVPVFRLLRNNAFGLTANIFFGAWVNGAFFVAVTWLSGQLINTYKLHPNVALAITIVSLIFNTVGLSLAGYGFDHGMPAITAAAGTLILGVGSGFGLYYWVGTGSLAALWVAPSLLHLVVGFYMALYVLPMTRIYHPLERTTGFSFAYATGYGILGGISPLVVTAFKAKLGADAASFAPAFWLLLLSGGSVIGIVLLKLYLPRLDKPYISRVR
ncbi:Putative proline/betaine transporter [Monoraphidium neglectum]|uniref:Putative proline/betaine transporter n=1 Tax=Monoraphidium neglectum TaxID=145388 RepID=A0A0D2M7K7_9CHLO|nr:Putative proline/betaine transporter [Monoraphidium neglectum]KIY99354.1 Putative proline/betaine transporter [Monoraphidium neglectum]|eukprot:XP_013898374.1 Putative proline/betaine transporter [Monoraphidium neglectum]